MCIKECTGAAYRSRTEGLLVVVLAERHDWRIGAAFSGGLGLFVIVGECHGGVCYLAVFGESRPRLAARTGGIALKTIMKTLHCEHGLNNRGLVLGDDLFGSFEDDFVAGGSSSALERGVYSRAGNTANDYDL